MKYPTERTMLIGYGYYGNINVWALAFLAIPIASTCIATTDKTYN